MNNFREEKVAEVIREFAGKFLLEEAGSKSLITVTNIKIGGDLKHATVYFTVYPEDGEKSALDFAKRKRSEFKEYLKDNSGLARIPQIDFEIDLGEKNRQLIDNISNL